MDDLCSYICREGVDASILDLGVAMPTAEAAAERLNVPIGAIFKSLVMTDGEELFFGAVLTGDARFNRKALAEVVGCKKVKFASTDEVLRETGFPPGGTPPVATGTDLLFILTSMR